MLGRSPMKLRGVLSIFLVLCVAYFLYRSAGPRRAKDDPSGQSRGRREGRQRHPRTESRDEQSGGRAEGSCSAIGITCASTYFATWTWPASGSCVLGSSHGYPVPDPRCTPGGVVPHLDAEVLRDGRWRTKCIRNCQSSEKQKHIAYIWYGLVAPAVNNGADQICELDHLVPLELGGADGLGNIWPQCGPDERTLKSRYFKQKDLVENYLAGEVRADRMSLDEAQRGIAADWTQYLDAVHRPRR